MEEYIRFFVSKASAQVGPFDFDRLIVPAMTPVTLSGLAALIVNIMLFVAGILAFIFLIYSGIIYITSGGNPDAAKKGQQGVIYTIIGIIVITLAFVLVRAVSRAVNPNF